MTRGADRGAGAGGPEAAARHRAGFTLIELMVAITIGALMMMIAIPALRAATKPPLVRATNDFLEACREARSRAILTGRAMQVVVFADEQATGIRVEPSTMREAGGPLPSDARPSREDGKPLFHAELPDDVAFRRLMINGRDAVAGVDDAAAIRFYPNGTCDALDAELQWQRREVRHITSELITGYLTVEDIR